MSDTPDNQKEIQQATDGDAEAIWKEMDAEESSPPAGDAPAGDETQPDEVAPGDGRGDGQDEAPPEEPKAQAPRDANEPDPRWNELPEWARTEFEKIRNSERSHHGRYVAAQRQLDALKNQMQARQPGETQQQADDRLEKVREKIAAIREDYPEIADPLADIIDTIGGTVNELKAAEQGRQQAARNEYAAYVEEQKHRLEETHPDWLDVLGNNWAAYEAWVEDQPKHIREAAKRNHDAIIDANETIDLISAFKQHLGASAPAPQPSPQQSRRDRQLAGSASPSRSASRPNASGLSPDADPQAAWDYFEKLDRQKARV